MEDILRALFRNYTGSEAELVTPLGQSGSNRRYYRLKNQTVSLIGTIGTDPEENRAFVSLDQHFFGKALNVPELLAVSEDGMAYLQEDLGDISLFKSMSGSRESGTYTEEDADLLCKVTSMLPDFQFRGNEGLDYSLCYPEAEFNSRLVNFDLNYFKYCFLKPSSLTFNESRLQDDFEKLTANLLSCTERAFLYRDFQSRNVMLRDKEAYFIDFQGGMKGPIFYDLASFVYQARAAYPDELRQKMIVSYKEGLKKYMPEFEDFDSKFRLFALFRTLQVLGAYGFRGLMERKAHFLESIPYAIDNLRQLLETGEFGEYAYLRSVLLRLCQMPAFEHPRKSGKLCVKIYSFSFKKGIPQDNSGNGGGYVFDCRALSNPGRYEYYRQFDGRDAEVVKFMQEHEEVAHYLAEACSMVDYHVRCFLERGFTSLQIAFGCTGGQHRSVYCAERMAEHLAANFDIEIRLIHRELAK